MMNKPDMSIVFSTFNRSAYLGQTLEAMCQVHQDGIRAEYVVVDNNSTDDTADVIESYMERLPIVRYFEARPGKNCALNSALKQAELGDIIVFTDDDVLPCREWLQKIKSACECSPEYDVFGGKIELIWPDGVQIPAWARENKAIRGIGFAEHDLGPSSRPYPSESVPSGPIYWIRSRVLMNGGAFDESMGPQPGQVFLMGDETEFLLRLYAAGAKSLYVPEVCVGHHVQPELLRKNRMLRRAIRYGRSTPRTRGLPDLDQLATTPWRWRMRRIAAIGWYLAKLVTAQFCLDETLRMKRGVEAMVMYGYHRQSLSMSWGLTAVAGRV